MFTASISLSERWSFSGVTYEIYFCPFRERTTALYSPRVPTGSPRASSFHWFQTTRGSSRNGPRY
ncbi:hypothetical protein CURTO8I2_220213 [Curtobacterium sp. 8I-2]|nr:hypothetical protein CURTO8I2_220213 [Curtobacterium sp. 8I-2]